MEKENFEEFDAIDLSSLGQMMNEFPQIGEELVEEEKNDGTESIEEVEEVVENETQEEPSSQDNDESSPLITPYAKMLVEEGLLPNIDIEKFDGTVEALIEAQREYDQQRFENFKESMLDPRVKWLQDNLEEGVPLTKLLELDQQKLSVNTLTEEALVDNEELQKDVLRTYYKETTTFTDDRIEKIIERLETLGELEPESKSSLQDLKSVIGQKEQEYIQQAKLEREAAIKRQQEELNTLKKTLETKDEIISGLKVSQLMKDKIYKTLTTAVDVDQNTGVPINRIVQARLENPLEFDVNLAYIFEATNGFKDWTPLGLSGKRKAIEEFEKSVKDIDISKGAPKRTLSNDLSKSYLKEMEKIAKQF